MTCCSFVIHAYVNVWYFHNVFRFLFVCNVFWVEFQRYCCRCCSGGGGGGGGGCWWCCFSGVCVYCCCGGGCCSGVSVYGCCCCSGYLSFNLLQSLYCLLSSILALFLQINIWSFSVLSIRKDSGSLLSSYDAMSIRHELLPDVNC